jgi:hypothetical protein
MKGVIFIEFVDYVERQFGLETVDAILTHSDLKSNGCYTRVGAYDHREMMELIARLSEMVKMSIPDLMIVFGYYLFFRLNTLYPYYQEKASNVLEFLSTIDGGIHVEVRKLYPDAELPHIHFIKNGEKEAELYYCSTRPFADIAQGLIQGCIDHFKESFSIRRLEGGTDYDAVFILTRKEDSSA